MSPSRTSRKQDPEEPWISERTCCSFPADPLDLFQTLQLVHLSKSWTRAMSRVSCRMILYDSHLGVFRIAKLVCLQPSRGVDLYRWAARCCSQLGSDYRCAAPCRHPSRQPTAQFGSPEARKFQQTLTIKS